MKQGSRTDHVPRPRRLAEEIRLVGQCVAEPYQELRAALEPGDLVPGTRLQALGQLVDRQSPQALPVDLVLVARVSGE